jgi:hypothetical protein
MRVTTPGERLCLSRSPGYLNKEILPDATRRPCYGSLTVQPGTAMTVKEMGPASLRGGPFLPDS